MAWTGTGGFRDRSIVIIKETRERLASVILTPIRKIWTRNLDLIGVTNILVMSEIARRSFGRFVSVQLRSRLYHLHSSADMCSASVRERTSWLASGAWPWHHGLTP